ncbi:MAG: hypothetical protein JW795_18320, partial [Chitinivibrionales bacterium]|nr:hypothetical protein [Chitinivibrionales bacterium]
YPGGFSARYGNALGGIIDITGRTAARKPSHQSDSTQGDHRPRVSIDANMTDCSIMAEADIGNGRSFIASTRRSFLGELMSFAAASVPEATIMTMAPYYWDYLLRFDNTFSPRSSAFFTLFGVNDELRLQATPSSLTSRANSSINLKNTFYMGILGWDYRLSSKGHLIMKIAGASGLNHFSGIDNLNNTVDYQSATVVSELTYRLNPITTMVLGCDIEATPSTISLQYRDKSGLKYLSQTKKQMLGDCGTFLMWQLHPRNNFNGKIGLRYDYYPQVDYFGPWLPQLADHPFFKNSTRFSGEPSLRLDATYTFRPNHVFTFAFGNYTQAPLRIEKPVYHQLDNVITTVSRANHVVGGYTWRASDMLSLELALYRNSQWNLSRPAFSDALITQGYNYVYDGRKKITGMELLLRRSRSRGFFGWISYTLSQSLEYNFDVNRFIPSEKDQTHNLTLTGTWFLPMQCDVGAKVQFSTGAPETPLVGYIYNEQTHTNQLLFGRPNSSRMPPSLTLDVRFDKKFTVKSCKYSAYIDFQNVGSLLYQSPQANPINEISVEKPINPQTHKQNKRYLYLLSIPSLGIRGEF